MSLSLCVCVCVYPTPPHGQYMTQGQVFRAEFNGFEFSFTSSRLVAILRLKITVCPTIYPKREGDLLDSYLSQGYLCNVKCNQPFQGFQLVSPCPLSTTIIITPQTPLSVYGCVCVWLCANLYIYLTYVSVCSFMNASVRGCVRSRIYASFYSPVYSDRNKGISYGIQNPTQTKFEAV